MAYQQQAVVLSHPASGEFFTCCRLQDFGLISRMAEVGKVSEPRRHLLIIFSGYGVGLPAGIYSLLQNRYRQNVKWTHATSILVSELIPVSGLQKLSAERS